MSNVPPELQAHREWLGQIGPVGLVVSPNVLIRQGVVINRQRSIEVQTSLAELIGDQDEARVDHALALFRDVLQWPVAALAGSPDAGPIPDALVAALPEYEDHIRPTYALPDPDRPAQWMLLIQETSAPDLDAKPSEAHASGWRASPQARLERLLRDTGVPIGLLFNGISLRLVYAPKHESSGHLTFTFKYLLETQGRPMAGALAALLGSEHVADFGPPAQRLSLLLSESRKSQNDVSTALAGQVLEALWELVRGFQQANEAFRGALLEQAMREAPAEVYGGLLTTLMRLVFVLYAEDRGLMPAGDVYQRNYSVAGLFERLREDAARYPDTMDARFGAWAQLLALFRLIHDGGRHGSLTFTARHGRLFDPDAYPYLEGRAHGTRRSLGDRLDAPRVSDVVVFRVLQNLLILDGERLSYRALDVEQIGSVYEAMMGFALQQAPGPSIAVSPKNVVINLAELLQQKGSERAKWLGERAELKLSSAAALSTARTVDDLQAALGKKVSRYTPRVLPVGTLYLQPTEERRRSGSHYTPRSLTEPIVRITLRPILERLGDQATPQQILDLKVCDPAMGSGAFLVEACRLLADRLVKAWDLHQQTPRIPNDEDAVTFAKRLVAERCLYGVDKNVFAIDLAKLSLWLATLAREHPFTFLDHALRHGDSLVGLSREQIACFNWKTEAQLTLVRSLIDQRVRGAQRLREQIQGLATSDDVPRKEHLLRDAEEALADVRLIGDVVVSSFFEREKTRDRLALRAAYSGKTQSWLDAKDSDVGRQFREELAAVAASLREDEHPIPPFHWEVEFPEVFTRENPGFDAFIGNPPFMGGKRISGAFGKIYSDWLVGATNGTNGNVDLVGFFFRRAYALLAKSGDLGLVATKTIRQGDTRSGSLSWICRNGGQIYSATRRMPWPGDASVVISVVHVAKDVAIAESLLDGVHVGRITAFLFHRGSSDDPARLKDNIGHSYIGCDIKGQGFLFAEYDPGSSALNLMNELLRVRPENSEVIRPYMSGEDLNNSPGLDAVRYVIDFADRSLEEAGRWPELLTIVREKVKPERQRKAPDLASWPWWQFWRTRRELREAVQGLSRMLVTAQTGNAQAFAFLSPRIVCSHSVVVFPFSDSSCFAILQSQAHLSWASLLGPSLKDDRRYAPSDCFETFPFPLGWRTDEALRDIGQRCYELRADVMLRRQEGLTQLYNRFHDRDEDGRDIVVLRGLHEAMDQAVLDSYGWTDVKPRCQFILDYESDDDDGPGKPSKKRKPFRYRWPDDIRDEVLGRLLELNAERAKGESTAPTKPARSRRSTKTAVARPLLEEPR
jgi:hypothetical protein